MAKCKRSKILDIAKTMPPLSHSIPGEEFDIKRSEVVRWMLQSPETWNYIWNNIKQSGVIAYDKSAGLWQGVEHGNRKS